MNVLLVEPNYKNKYPPLGLMKLSTFHKNNKDNVTFYKGLLDCSEIKNYDRIYITTLFTFYYDRTIKTIDHYVRCSEKSTQIFVGGIMASIMQEEIKSEPLYNKINLVCGLLNDSKILGFEESVNIDVLIPDYSIIDNYTDYTYKYSNDYMIFSSRGCIRNCSFCVVPKLEPEFKKTCDLKTQIEAIDQISNNQKQNLIIMDNNVLALPKNELMELIDQIEDLGFKKNSSFYNYIDIKGRKHKKRKFVDFNQGIDIRLLTESIMKELSRIEIKPLRLAFDHANPRFIEMYIDRIKLAARYGFTSLSNYVLFNYNDTVDDFYKRIAINIDLNEELGTSIFSFPMKYVPIKGEHSKDRKYVGKHWTAKELRGVQCILAATRGVVGPKRSFFYKAFGKSVCDFKFILLLPEKFIIYRSRYDAEITIFKNIYNSLTTQSKIDFKSLVSDNNFREKKFHSDKNVNILLGFY
jgi:hypothetical protein